MKNYPDISISEINLLTQTVNLSCGETEGTVTVEDMERQAQQLIPILRHEEKRRLEEKEIVESTVARFYI